MTTPELTDEQLLLAWQELTKEQQRRFDRLFDTDQAVRLRCILDELGGETEVEAQAKALAELPEKHRGKAVSWIARRIIRPLVDAISPSQDAPAPSTDEPRQQASGHSAPRLREGQLMQAPSNPPHVWEEKAGIVRIQTGEPNPASPLGYCEIGHWKLDNRGWLVVRNEDGAVLRECRLESGQDPNAMAAKLLRASWSESREADFGRQLQYPPDDWMA